MLDDGLCWPVWMAACGGMFVFRWSAVTPEIDAPWMESTASDGRRIEPLWDWMFLRSWHKQQLSVVARYWKKQKRNHKLTLYGHALVHLSNLVIGLCRGDISCSLTASYLADLATHNHTHLQTWMNKQCSDVCVSSPQCKIQSCLLAEAVCRFLCQFFFLPVCLSFLFFISSCQGRGLKLSPPPLLVSVSSASAQKNGSWAKKKVTEKNEMRSNLILIWFLLGSCFNPLWAGLPA